MGNKFTPGPWFIHPGSDKNAVQVRVQRTDKPQFHRPVAVCGGWGTTPDENKVNAQLIAAAPEMFQSLETIAAILNDETNDAESHWLRLLDIADKALKKARGEG